MPYWIKYAITVVILLLIIRFFSWAYDKIKQKGVNEHENRKTLGRFIAKDPKIKRALQIEKIYIAREFFLKPGVIQRRSCPGTDEDDR